MSYNGSGTFQINTSGQPVVTGTSISSTVFNALTADLATGLSTAITKDGQTTTTARIPFALGINSTLVTDATNTTSGSIITAGGVGIAKALFVGTTANVAGAVTLGGVATFSAQPIFSSLTASSAVATDASKGLVSVTNTGTGNNVLATAPTIASLNLTTALTIASAAGTVGQALTSGGSGNAPTWSTIAATPGGSTTQVQYNNAGAFGGISGVTTDGTRMTASTTIGVGAATPSTSGAGITFPATQSASSNANTLDDYEEGTWTPSLGGTSTGTFTGTYVKVGKLVTLYSDISVALIGTGSTTQITGIPFTAISGGSGSLTPSYTTSLATAIVLITAYVDGSTIYIASRTAAAASGSTNAIFGNGTSFSSSCTYIATA
jgi:hypothetical protein